MCEETVYRVLESLVLSAEYERGKNTVLQVDKPHGPFLTLVLHLNKQLEITKDSFV